MTCPNCGCLQEAGYCTMSCDRPDASLVFAQALEVLP